MAFLFSDLITAIATLAPFVFGAAALGLIIGRISYARAQGRTKRVIGRVLEDVADETVEPRTPVGAGRA